jgi:hypothetical protein
LEVFRLSLLAAAVSCYCCTHTGAQAEAKTGTVRLTAEHQLLSNHERFSHNEQDYTCAFFHCAAFCFCTSVCLSNLMIQRWSKRSRYLSCCVGVERKLFSVTFRFFSVQKRGMKAVLYRAGGAGRETKYRDWEIFFLRLAGL